LLRLAGEVSIGWSQMNIQFIVVGKLKEKYLVDGIQEYSKRMAPYAKLTFTELADEKAPESMSAAEELQVKTREGERILAAIKPDAHVIALAIQGETWTSEQFAAHMDKQATYGKSAVTFVIGGSLGLSDAVLQRANVKLSFGRMTYPHQLMRLLLVEQVYRTFKINRGEPYHK
jgi:23S rRNA (pseudouridine1915-N3)-methyltransferase